MARMIPPNVDASTVSAAERRLFDLFKHEPGTADWTVLHSLGLVRRGRKPYGEIDFVVLIPSVGIFCLEVKGGRIACNGGVWETTDRNGTTIRLNRSPFLQAREGMFALRDSVTSRAPVGFPSELIYGYAVVMPDVSFSHTSPEWELWQVIDREAVGRSIANAIMCMAAEQRRLLRSSPPSEPSASTLRTVQQLLRPDFDIVISKGTTIEDTEAQLLRLTAEQFEVLDALSGNDRCLFEGAAGTGKTVLALEYARRAAGAGSRTLLVCFNRLLGDWLARQSVVQAVAGPLITGSYFRLVRSVIMRSSIASDFLEVETRGPSPEIYDEVYPTCGRLAIEETGDQYDVLVVDEAQDLLAPRTLEVFDAWLKGGLSQGRWAAFGDFERQAIFGTHTGEQLKAGLGAHVPQFAKGRLTLNCRNTRNIGEETALLSGFPSPPYRMGQVVGPPVDYRFYKASSEQAAIVADAVCLLLRGGVRPEDVVILSRLRLEHSGIAGLERNSSFSIVEASDHSPRRPRPPLVRFSTVQAFKGMESSVVILCDVDQVTEREPQALLYVAMSRARTQLVVCAHERTRVPISECVRRRLQEGWKVRQ